MKIINLKTLSISCVFLAGIALYNPAFGMQNGDEGLGVRRPAIQRQLQRRGEETRSYLQFLGQHTGHIRNGLHFIKFVGIACGVPIPDVFDRALTVISFANGIKNIVSGVREVNLTNILLGASDIYYAKNNLKNLLNKKIDIENANIVLGQNIDVQNHQREENLFIQQALEKHDENEAIKSVIQNNAKELGIL